MYCLFLAGLLCRLVLTDLSPAIPVKFHPKIIGHIFAGLPGSIAHMHPYFIGCLRHMHHLIFENQLFRADNVAQLDYFDYYHIP